MDWKQLKDNTVAMMQPDWFAIKATVFLFFVCFVPIITLFYIFTELGVVGGLSGGTGG
jgi:hypothetical protein